MERILTGNLVNLNTSHPLHFNGKSENAASDKEDVASSFADMLKGVIGKTNDLQVESSNLMQKMVYQPESVDIHNVMITAQKAEIALTFARSVRDEALKGYRELMNLR
jgi:flagellar hook-basal body complex protein FliE